MDIRSGLLSTSRSVKKVAKYPRETPKVLEYSRETHKVLEYSREVESVLGRHLGRGAALADDGHQIGVVDGTQHLARWDEPPQLNLPCSRISSGRVFMMNTI